MCKIYVSPFLFLFLFPLFLFAQPAYDPDQKIAPDLLKEDLTILKETLEKVHTGLYTYNPKTAFDQFFADLSRSINKPMTALEFYRDLRPLLSLIRNGHTGIHAPRAFIEKIRDEIVLFPIDVYWYNDQLYVYRNLSDDKSFVPGSVIQRINGENAHDIYFDFARHVSTDGYNRTVPIDEAFLSFKVLFVTLKGSPTQFDLEILTPKGKTIRGTVDALLNKELAARREEQNGAPFQSFWSSYSKLPAMELKIEEDIATMRIRTFDSKFAKKQKKQKFKKFYKQSFKKIAAAGVKHLILDLRSNGGGDPMPTIELFAHLHPEPFTFYKDVYSWTQRIPNKHLYPNLDFTSKKLFPLVFKKKGEHYRPNWIARLGGLKGLKESKPNKPYYDKQVYVLTDSGSFSATGEITGLIKSYDRAIFIGEEPGGNAYQNTSGITETMVLPNSKVRVDIPFWLWIMNVEFENTGHGVIPDHIVRQSIEDRINKKDTVMKYALDLIKSQKN